MTTARKKRNNIPEWIAALYMNLFVLIRPLLKIYSERSTLFLACAVLALIAIDLMLGNFRLNSEKILKLFGLAGVVSAVFVLDYVFRKNPFTWENYYYFIIYGVISAFFLMNVTDVQKLLSCWTILAFIGGLTVLIDPMNDYSISGDYMAFGMAIVPAFAATLVLISFYKKKIFLPFSAAFFLEIVLFANRGSTLVAIVLLIFTVLFISGDKSKRVVRSVFIILITGIVLILLDSIFEILFIVIDKLGMDSYSLRAFQNMLNGLAGSDSGRIDIWNHAFYEIKNNFFLGMGIGGFESKYGNYAHNFFLDILVTHGVLIGLAVFGLLFFMFRNTFRSKNRYFFILSSVMGVIWFTQLMSSQTYWKEALFWQFIILNMFLYEDKLKQIGTMQRNGLCES